MKLIERADEFYLDRVAGGLFYKTSCLSLSDDIFLFFLVDSEFS